MASAQWSGTLGSVTGVTATTLVQVSPASGLQRVLPNTFASHAMFGLSTTSVVAGQTWTIAIQSRVIGTTFKIAEVAGIGGAQFNRVIPIVNTTGTTQSDFVGVPTPTHVLFTGSSAGIGLTFSAVVTGVLQAI